jgi:hypothetical protein
LRAWHISGAPEEIRTPDPQIRSLDPFVDPTSFSCKPDSNSALTLQGVRSPSANRFDPIEAAPATPIAAELQVIGGGPVFRKADRYPVYEPSELDRWAEVRIGPPQRSTSEVDPA